MYKEELKSSKLAQFLNEYDYVFVDTCSLMEDSFPLFMDYLSRSKEYWKEELQVIVLGECIEELKKHAKEKEKERKIAALRALKIIRHDKWHEKALTITKAEGSSFADNAIFTKVSGLRIHNKILVITQDKTLTTDLLKLNRLDSQKGRYLSVYRLTAQSELEKNPGENGEKTFNKKHEASSFQKVEKDNKVAPLSKAQRLIIEEDDKLVKNLSNPNYKTKNKVKDIENQLSKMNKLDAVSLSALKLRFSKEDLLKKKEELLPPNKGDKKEKKQEKEENSSVVASGKSPSEALKRLALNYHSIVRDSSVPYVPSVHGELDLTSDDLKKVDDFATSKGNFSYNKGTLTYSFEKAKEYSASCKMAPSPKKEEQKQTTPVAKKEENKKPSLPKKEETKKTKTSPQPSKKENKPLPKEKPLISKDDPLLKKKIRIVKVKGNTSGGSSSAIPEGIVLVVGEPKTKTPRKEKAPVLKKKDPIKNDSFLLKETMDADRILNANLNNPNYPKEKALVEIQKQKTRLKKLSSKDLSSLQLSLADLERIEKTKK